MKLKRLEEIAKQAAPFIREVAIQASPFIVLLVGGVVATYFECRGNYHYSTNALLISSAVGLMLSGHVTREREDNGENYQNLNTNISEYKKFIKPY